MTKFLCLCATYGRPRHLIENALACFEAQSYPHRMLIMLDDLGNIGSRTGDRWRIISTANRCPSMPHKYRMMVDLMKHEDWNALAIWDDDDLYLENHLDFHARVLADHPWSHPSRVWSTYTGRPVIEDSRNSFWASHACRRTSMEDAGGWKDTPDMRFDNWFMASLGFDKKGDPCKFGGPQFVFRWGDTGATHCQHLAADDNWYARVRIDCDDAMEVIRPGFDPPALRTMAQIRQGIAAG